MEIGPAELIIILVIVLLLFGPGRVSKIGGELGAAVHEFRRGLSEGKSDKGDEAETPEENAPQDAQHPTSA